MHSRLHDTEMLALTRFIHFEVLNMAEDWFMSEECECDELAELAHRRMREAVANLP